MMKNEYLTTMYNVRSGGKSEIELYQSWSLSKEFDVVYRLRLEMRSFRVLLLLGLTESGNRRKLPGII